MVKSFAEDFENLSLSTKDTKEIWKSWLSETFEVPKLTSLEQFISCAGQKIPFEPIRDNQKIIREVIDGNKNGGNTKNDVVIGLLTGSPGSGKTRTLVEMDQYIDDSHVFIISFNNGNPPKDFDKDYGAEYSISLRFIHSVYASYSTFDAFTRKVKEAGLLEKDKLLSFEATFEMLSKEIKKRIVVAIDEFNELMRPGFETYIKDFSDLLKSTSKLCPRPIFYVAATSCRDLRVELRNSGVEFMNVPLVPFSSDHKEKIIDLYAQNCPNLQPWRTNRKF